MNLYEAQLYTKLAEKIFNPPLIEYMWNTLVQAHERRLPIRTVLLDWNDLPIMRKFRINFFFVTKDSAPYFMALTKTLYIPVHKGFIFPLDRSMFQQFIFRTKSSFVHEYSHFHQYREITKNFKKKQQGSWSYIPHVDDTTNFNKFYRKQTYPAKEFRHFPPSAQKERNYVSLKMEINAYAQEVAHLIYSHEILWEEYFTYVIKNLDSPESRERFLRQIFSLLSRLKISKSQIVAIGHRMNELLKERHIFIHNLRTIYNI